MPVRRGQPVADPVPQRLGGPVAGAQPGVQPAVPLDGLGARTVTGSGSLRIGPSRRPRQTPTTTSATKAWTTATPTTSAADRARAASVVDRSGGWCRHQPDELRLRAEDVHRECGVALGADRRIRQPAANQVQRPEGGPPPEGRRNRRRSGNRRLGETPGVAGHRVAHRRSVRPASPPPAGRPVGTLPARAESSRPGPRTPRAGAPRPEQDDPRRVRSISCRAWPRQPARPGDDQRRRGVTAGRSLVHPVGRADPDALVR